MVSRPSLRKSAKTSGTKSATSKKDDAERSRRKFARRQWARRWLVWRYILAFVVVVGLVAGGIYAVYFSHALSVQGVTVVGAQTLTTEQVLAAADVPQGGPLATVDLVAIERRVGSLAPVRSVDVSRQWPHSVRIEIDERVPVAVVARGGVLRAVDADGVVFNSYKRAPAGLPRIETDDDTDVEALREAVIVVAALPPEVSSVVDHLELVSSDQIDLVLDGDRTVHWGSADQSGQKAEVIVALLQQQASTYDVSVPGQPTISGGPAS
ncbi:hypothetical protein BH11ACT8_BH11ACT8_22100 [soil metagenome]